MMRGPTAKKLWVTLLIGLAGSLTVSGPGAGEGPDGAGSVGLSVAPGGLAIQNVTPGQTYDLAQRSGVVLRISNHDTRPRTYRLSANKPSAVGNRKWLPGYLEIPDPAWFWFEQDELTIQPESEGSVKMSLKVPEGDQYDNQHWTVSIGVQGISQPGEMLALAAYPRYQIETESKQDIEAIPAGSLGLKPSVLRFEGLPLGTKQEGRMTLYNNDATRKRYTLAAKTILVDPTREQIVPSPGYAWIPEPRWVSVRKRRVVIKGQQNRTVTVRLNVPSEPEYYGKHWEVLLWIEPDEGLPRFARIQMETIPAPVIE